VAVGADDVRLGAAVDRHAPAGVAQRLGPGDIGADVIAGDDVLSGIGPADGDAVDGVGRDDVALEGVAHAVAVGADDVRLGAAADAHPQAAVAQRAGAGGVGAAPVPGDDVQPGARAADVHSVGQVARDPVPPGGGPRVAPIAPDSVRLRSVKNGHAV